MKKHLTPATISAAAAALLALVYLIAGLASGHSAAASLPVDYSSKAESVDVYQALTLLADSPGQVAILDVRPARGYSLYHLPGSQSLPGGDAGELMKAALGNKMLVVAQSDEAAAALVGELRSHKVEAQYLAGGAQAWYLALDLPVPLFADTPPPAGYAQALGQIRHWLKAKDSKEPADTLKKAIDRLAAASYTPTKLKSSGKPKASGKKKKISGGCS